MVPADVDQNSTSRAGVSDGGRCSSVFQVIDGSLHSGTLSSTGMRVGNGLPSTASGSSTVPTRPTGSTVRPPAPLIPSRSEPRFQPLFQPLGVRLGSSASALGRSVASRPPPARSRPPVPPPPAFRGSERFLELQRRGLLPSPVSSSGQGPGVSGVSMAAGVAENLFALRGSAHDSRTAFIAQARAKPASRRARGVGPRGPA